MWEAVTQSSVNVTIFTIELHCKICNNYCRISYLFLGYRSAGFLASLTADVGGSAATYIRFDREAYDYGDNYNPSTGLYTVPYDGIYLIHARIDAAVDLAGQ